MSEIADRTAALATLRKPFPAENIAKLPKVNCRNCTQQKSACGQNGHRMAKCNDCGAWITTAHIHLDYVGHAEATDRLLDADPEWTWEPMAFTPEGLPRFDADGGMWIKLTVAGVTRLGYGSADGKKGPNATKEIIGDAIRNAGMRFGMALDLWAKTDLHFDERDDEPEPEPERPAQRERGQSDSEWESAAPVKPGAVSKGQITNLVMEFKKLGIESDEERHQHAGQFLGRPIATFNDLTADEVTRLKKALRGGWPHVDPSLPSPEHAERSEVFNVVSKFIADAQTPEQLAEAGGDIAKEKERGGLTPAEVTMLRAEWSARKRDLEARDAMNGVGAMA